MYKMVHTSLWRKLLQIQLQTYVVFGFWLGFHSMTILALENLVYTVLDQLVPTPYAHGEQEASLAFGSGKVKSDAVKIYELDIEG